MVGTCSKHRVDKRSTKCVDLETVRDESRWDLKVWIDKLCDNR